MAASAADVRSVLSIPVQPFTPAPPQSKKPTALSTRKPEGISRELYSLIGPSAPSLAAQLAKPRLKQKPNLGGDGKVKWEWQPFKNGARSDSLQLSHWVKSTTDPSADYAFAKYNVQSTAYTYSQDEYTRLLDGDGWTKEETDYLFHLVHDYDSRWYIIHDRYDYPGGALRTLEDIKDRYFSVCRKLVRNRPWAGDETSKAQLLSSFVFDKGNRATKPDPNADRELTRKQYVASLESRTSEQIAEEEALYIEVKRLEQNERRFKKERDELLRTLAGIDSGLPDVIPDEDGPTGGSFIFDGKSNKKNKKSVIELDSPMTPSNVIALGPPIIRRPQSAKSAAYDALHCIVRTDALPTPAPTTKAAHQPVFLRSLRLPLPKQAIAPKITQVLSELGVRPDRMVMPTRENCQQFESLLDAASALVETKRVVDKTQYEINVLKERLGIRTSEGGESGEGDAVVMDVDDLGGVGEQDAEGEPDEEGAPSVVSTRSGRSRKHSRSRRSMSMASVDTSATVSTRAGTKRQKRG